MRYNGGVDWVYRFSQYLFAFPLWLLSKGWFRLEIRGRENLKDLRGPLLLVSNHKSYIDHFLILISLPLPLTPARIMTDDVFFRMPLVGLALRALGTFSNFRGQGIDISLAKPVEILKGGGIVGIYPEGKRVLADGLGEFRRGAGDLTKRTGVRVLPMAVQGTQDLFLHVFPRMFGRVCISFGKPFTTDQNQTAEMMTQAIRERVSDLYTALNVPVHRSRFTGAEISKVHGLERHGILTTCLRLFTVPFLNRIPALLIQKMLTSSSRDARQVVRHAGTTRALEAMYTRYHRNIFSRGVLPGIADAFWHHAVSQPKALRNRLRIVEKNLEEEIIKQRSQSEELITILNVGGGSSRAAMHSLHRLFTGKSSHNIQIINIDKDPHAIALSKEIAQQFGLADTFTWINDNARNIHSLIAEKSVDIVEMVGLLDYFSEEKSVAIIAQIYNVLKPGGLFITANICPNSEMPLIHKSGWPNMYFRQPDDIAKILMAAGFLREPTIVFEPLQVHAIATVRK